jgi:hypothetical protein
MGGILVAVCKDYFDRGRLIDDVLAGEDIGVVLGRSEYHARARARAVRKSRVDFDDRIAYARDHLDKGRLGRIYRRDEVYVDNAVKLYVFILPAVVIVLISVLLAGRNVRKKICATGDKGERQGRDYRDEQDFFWKFS